MPTPPGSRATSADSSTGPRFWHGRHPRGNARRSGPAGGPRWRRWWWRSTSCSRRCWSRESGRTRRSARPWPTRRPSGAGRSSPARTRPRPARRPRSRGAQEASARAEAESSRNAALVETAHTLLSETRAVRLSREPGWSVEAIANLRRLAAPGAPGRDIGRLRDEAVACLAGLDVVERHRLTLAGSPSALSGVRYSPDGTLLASYDRFSHKLILWDANRVAPIAAIPAAANGPAALIAFGFRPDGSCLAYATEDGYTSPTAPFPVGPARPCRPGSRGMSSPAPWPSTPRADGSPSPGVASTRSPGWTSTTSRRGSRREPRSTSRSIRPPTRCPWPSAPTAVSSPSPRPNHSVRTIEADEPTVRRVRRPPAGSLRPGLRPSRASPGVGGQRPDGQGLGRDSPGRGAADTLRQQDDGQRSRLQPRRPDRRLRRLRRGDPALGLPDRRAEDDPQPGFHAAERPRLSPRRRRPRRGLERGGDHL